MRGCWKSALLWSFLGFIGHVENWATTEPGCVSFRRKEQESGPESDGATPEWSSNWTAPSGAGPVSCAPLWVIKISKHTPPHDHLALASCTFPHTPHHPAHHHTSLPPTKNYSPNSAANIENSPRTASKPPTPDNPDTHNPPQCLARSETSSRYGSRNHSILRLHELGRLF